MGRKRLGKVYLVGCGPGASDLLTLRAVNVLRRADVVLHDRLIDPKVLSYAKNAEKIPCGKNPGEALKQGWINKILHSEAGKGNIVVRLKNGDPMIFGRGGEELKFLQERGVRVEVVPGLSSATSVPALVKIPLTQRGISSSLTVLTGRLAKGKRQTWRCLGDTVVVLMAVENIDTIAKQLMRAGKASTAPCAFISEGATEKERLVVSTLDKIADLIRRLDMKAPSVLVVGEVVRSLLDFRGKMVVAFRSRDEVKRTERLIKRAGGIPNVSEICEMAPAGRELKRAASGRWDTLVFMSASGVRSAAKFFDFNKYKLVAVGRTTQMELKRRGHRRVLVPRAQNLDGVRGLFVGKRWGRILAFRSPLADEKLEGATNIVAYHVRLKNLDLAIRGFIGTKNDFTLLTSSGLLNSLVRAASRLGVKQKFVEKMNQSLTISLGASITSYATRNGITVNYEPEEPNLESLFRGGG